MEKFSKGFVLLVAVIALAGCVSTKHPPSDPRDPYEHFNRQVFAFNMAVDRAFLRPVAKTYDFIIPWPAKKGIRNFFGNIQDVTSAANEILQFHFPQAIADLARVVINTTLGIGGLFDVADSLGLEKDKEDFGLTLGMWGAKGENAGPYLMVPFLGPNNLRDLMGKPIDYLFLSVWPYIPYNALRYGLEGGNIIQKRVNLLPGDSIIEQAFDPYLFLRDAYLQRRAYMVKEAKEEHVLKYTDEKGVKRRRHRSIPVRSVLAD